MGRHAKRSALLSSRADLKEAGLRSTYLPVVPLGLPKPVQKSHPVPAEYPM